MRDRSTRLAVSVRDRAIAISFVMSSSPMVNSTTSRAAAILKASFSESPNKATMHRRKIESRSTQRFHGIAALERSRPEVGAANTPLLLLPQDRTLPASERQPRSATSGQRHTQTVLH